jgi:hypothetical protein
LQHFESRLRALNGWVVLKSEPDCKHFVSRLRRLVDGQS